MEMGVIIRDHKGSSLVACSEQFEEVVAPEIAKVLAMQRAIILAKKEVSLKLLLARTASRWYKK
jgi:hypothetical protein